MVEERTAELAPPTIFVNFAEVKRYTKTLSRACEIAAFTPEKKTLYNKSLMNERDILAQKEFAVNEALLKGREAITPQELSQSLTNTYSYSELKTKLEL